MKSLKVIVEKKVEILKGYEKADHLYYDEAPKLYNSIISTEHEVEELLKQVAKSQGWDNHLKRHVDLVMTDIATEVRNADLTFENIIPYTQDEFIEVFITDRMDKYSKEQFESLFYFMPEDTRNRWLETNHLINFNNVYCTKMLDMIFILGN